MNNLDDTLKNDIHNILSIKAVPSMLNVICKTTGMKFAAVARVTDDRWVTCVSRDEINFGLKPGDELELETTLCNEIRQHKDAIVIDHVSQSATYCNHHTPAKYGFESYISFPIFRKNGEFFGTLCAIDPEPAKLDNEVVRELFNLYTDLISFHLEALEELNDAHTNLDEANRVAKLRDTFVAVLGHDLRNPLGTTRMCADILMKLNLPEFANKQVSTIKTTSLRMQELIDNLLDFARGELGEGIQLEIGENAVKLEQEINQIIKETRTTDSQHDIVATIKFDSPVFCDVNRVGQLFSNLLSNAVKHGHENTPIYIEASNDAKELKLKVINSGEQIAPEIREELFKPFVTNNKNGLGLGLYIASEIAMAHNGSLEVSSHSPEIAFEFTMPLQDNDRFLGVS
ncbi:MAG: histidine kinase [Cytophagaceae bacterium]|nr:histidine kinase [Cytophagaceae bacterium]